MGAPPHPSLPGLGKSSSCYWDLCQWEPWLSRTQRAGGRVAVQNSARHRLTGAASDSMTASGCGRWLQSHLPEPSIPAALQSGCGYYEQWCNDHWYMCFCVNKLLILLGLYLEVEMLDWTPNCFPQWLQHLKFPPASPEDSKFSTSSLIILWYFFLSQLS